MLESARGAMPGASMQHGNNQFVQRQEDAQQQVQIPRQGWQLQ